MVVNSPGKHEEDPETAVGAVRQDGVKEAGWTRLCLERAGGVETLPANSLGPCLTFLSESAQLS